MIEAQRQRLYDGIQRIYDVAHAYCACPDSEIKRIIDEEFEASLRVIDLVVMRTGAFYAVEIKGMADKVCAVAERIEEEGTDRKSTRLNSSHVSISYAVFCLKKKQI